MGPLKFSLTIFFFFFFNVLCSSHQRRQWHSIPVLLPGESQGRGSLEGCSPWGHTESDTTEVTEQQQAYNALVQTKLSS